MANVANINGLVAKVRQRADQINSTTYNDATELKPWLKDSLAQLYEILVSRWQDYYTIARPLSLVAGQSAYSLPADLRELDSVWMMYNAGKSRVQLKQFEADQMDALQRSSTFYGMGYQTYKYRIMRNRLWVLPSPNVDIKNALELFYVPQYQAPLLDYTSIDDVLPNGWEEWVVLDMLAKMAVKSRLIDLAAVETLRGATERRLLAAASIRSGIAPVMRDATRRVTLYGVGGSAQGAAYWSAP
jgi:hypothetical protein